jgi:regulatory protein
VSFGGASSKSRGRRTFATTPAHEIESAVKEKCLSLLAMQPRIVTQVLDRLTVVGLVDDASFAQAYVRTGVAVRRRGTRSLRSELRGRGVSDADIETAAEEVSEDTERATALALASRRAPSLARFAPEVRRRRLMGLLVRRGFDSAIVSSVLSEVMASFATDFGADDEGGDDDSGE